MKYRKLGRTGMEVSEIGFGTWGLGGNSYGEVDDEISIKTLNLAFEKGVNFFDTADLYGNGHSEEIIAEAINGHRDKIIIATKGGTLPHRGFTMPQDFSEQHLAKALHGSLKRLKTDYVDLFQLHSPQIDDIERCNVINTLEQFKTAGKIREYGISARSPQDGLLAIDKYNFPVVQVNYNMADQRAAEINLFEASERNNTGVIIRTPLVFGYLAGKLTGGEKLQDSDHRSNWPKEQLMRWANAPRLFNEMNKDKTRTLVQLALQFCLFKKAVSTVIPGMMNINEVKENIDSIYTEKLTDVEMEQIYHIYRDNIFYDKNIKHETKK